MKYALFRMEKVAELSDEDNIEELEQTFTSKDFSFNDNSKLESMINKAKAEAKKGKPEEDMYKKVMEQAEETDKTLLKNVDNKTMSVSFD